MDLDKRLVLLKSSTKEEEYPAYTPEDVLFLIEEFLFEEILFEEVTCPEGVILGHSDPSGWGLPCYGQYDIPTY